MEKSMSSRQAHPSCKLLRWRRICLLGFERCKDLSSRFFIPAHPVTGSTVITVNIKLKQPPSDNHQRRLTMCRSSTPLICLIRRSHTRESRTLAPQRSRIGVVKCLVNEILISPRCNNTNASYQSEVGICDHPRHEVRRIIHVTLLLPNTGGLNLNVQETTRPANQRVGEPRKYHRNFEFPLPGNYPTLFLRL